jgi:uncharacterized membrane protein YedE/YeeE
MTMASGCGSKTLIRIGGGNMKSLVVLAVAAGCAYLMMWTDFYERFFAPWIAATSINLGRAGISGQDLGSVIGGLAGLADPKPLRLAIAAGAALLLGGLALSWADFRARTDNLLGGLVVGLAVVAGWYLTGGAIGQAWKEWAEMADIVPSRVTVQSFTFISPMGDTVRYLMTPGTVANLNFGVMALVGVIAGSLLYSVLAGRFHLEWFASGGDFANHVAGGVLMGIGGVMAMGCTIGQAVTGVSTLAIGSLLTFAAIVAGAAATMKYQYWALLRAG